MALPIAMNPASPCIGSRGRPALTRAGASAARQPRPHRVAASASCGRTLPAGASERPVAISRRGVLPISLSVLMGLSQQPPQAAAAAEAKAFNNNGVAFEYPAGWLKAYDRTDKGAVGGLVLIGDFKTVDTISLVSSEIPEELQSISGGSLDPELVAQEVLREPLSSTSTMTLEIVSSARAEGHAPGPTYQVEYILEVCRGSVEEGAGGALRCVGPQGNELQTVKRHHVDLVTERNGSLYKFSVSAEEQRWGQVSADLIRALDTFVITG